MAAQNPDQNITRHVTSAQAMKVLANAGIQVTEEDATLILEYLYFLGKITVDQYIKDKSTAKEQKHEKR